MQKRHYPNRKGQTSPGMWAMLLLAVFMACPVYALTVTTSEGFTSYTLNAGLEYRLQPDAQRPAPNAAWDVSRDTLTFGFNPSHLWIRFGVHNTSALPQDLILDIEYPLLDEVDVIVVSPTGDERIHYLGDLRPISEQEIEHPHLLTPITLAPGEENKILIRVKTEATLNIPMTLWSKSAFIGSTQHDTAYDLLMYGILIGVALYHLLLFVQLREPAYFWYSVFLLSLVSVFAYFQGYINAYVISDIRDQSNYFLPWAYALVASSCILYIQPTLDLPRSRPGYSRALTITMCAGMLLAVVSSFIAYSIAIKLLTVYAVGAALIVIGAQAIRAIDRYEPAFYGVSAGAFLVAGMGITVLEKTGQITSTPLSRSAGDIGFTIMAIFYALLLSQRMRWEQDRRHKAEQAVALSNAELLQTQKQLNQELDSLVHARTQELEKANERLHHASVTDPLTKLYNRRYFDDALVTHHDSAIKFNESLAVILLDIDHFKRINDTYGHPAGDVCLITIAQRIKSVGERYEAICARYGGEEFILLLQNKSQSEAQHIAEDLLTTIKQSPVPIPGGEITVTTSIGLAIMTPQRNTNPDDILKSADDLLYKAKDAGRDRIFSSPAAPVN
jgi:diguanylate cyclase